MRDHRDLRAQGLLGDRRDVVAVDRDAAFVDFEDQIDQKNLISFNANYTTAKTLRYNNTNFNNTTTADYEAYVRAVQVVNAAVAAKPGQRAFRYTETTTLRSRSQDVDNPALAHAPCQTSFNAIVSWLIAFDIINLRNRAAANAVRVLDRVTAPVMAPVRRIIPSIGGLDLSPVIVIVVITGVQRYLLPALFGWLASILVGPTV